MHKLAALSKVPQHTLNKMQSLHSLVRVLFSIFPTECETDVMDTRCAVHTQNHNFHTHAIISIISEVHWYD